MRSVDIRAGTASYRAIVTAGALEHLAQWLDEAGLGGRARVIADRRVWSRHGTAAEASLRSAGRDVRVAEITAGEEQKSLVNAAALYDWLIEVGTDRGDCIIAVGGGVIGDLAGFVAATYLRGLPLVQVPTTLLAMVDSSIGGKAAVNHRLGKNLIGAFHQPRLVVADTRLLAGLPEREYRAGWAEIVKMAMISDAALFRRLREHSETLLGFGDERLLTDVIRRAIELKGLVVGEDEREDGRRIILNYGHTIGHALEAATDYHRYLHGEAVAIGMAAAGFIANRRGILGDDSLNAQTELLARFGLPATIGGDGVTADALLGPLARDKKARGKTIQWVLATDIGRVTMVRDVTANEVRAALTEIGCS